MRRRVLFTSAAAVTGAGLLVVGLVHRSSSHHRAVPSPSSSALPSSSQGTSSAPAPPLAHAEPASPNARGPSPPPRSQALAGLDLLHMTVQGDGASARVAGGTAHLTIDPELDDAAQQLMAAHHLPEAAVVLMDVASGRLLVYASRVAKGAPHDVCAEATAPSASVFKLVTAAALIEDAHLGPDTKQCYSGGESRITAANLLDRPARDRWCTTLAGALGHSINTVFARLAAKDLTPSALETMAHRFGYGQPIAFDVPVQASAVHVPEERLELARTAAGFWNSTLSPLEAAELSAIVARGGEAVRPSVVEKVVSDGGQVVWSAPDPPPAWRVIAPATAADLTVMMDRTVSEGTSFRAFHHGRGDAYLPGIPVAGKTGTLSNAAEQRFYTWFTGFAPSRPLPGVRQVAIAALVVNGPIWQLKANVLARDILRAYFAKGGAHGVSQPSLASVARHRRGPA